MSLAAGLQAEHVAATHVFSGINYSSGTTTALFEIPSIDASGAIIAGSYDYVGIYASSTDAYRITDAAAGSARISGEKKLTSVLEALSFSYDAPSFPSVTSITADATTSARVRDEMAQSHVREHVYLRNI